MNLNDLNCPQFVNFDSPEFLCAELSSISLDAHDWCDLAKKSEETVLKDGKIKCQENFESQFHNEELSDEKENQTAKAEPKKNEFVNSNIGVKRKLTGLNIGEGKIISSKKGFQYHATSKHANFNPLRQLQPSLTVQSPQLPVIKRRRLASALEDKATHKKLDAKTPKPASQAIDPKPTVPKVQDALSAKVPSLTLKTTSNFQFRARPVPSYILKGPRCQKPKEVKRDLKIQKPLSTQPPGSTVNVKKSTEIQPFKFDRFNKEKFQKQEKNFKDLENEKKVFIFSAHPKPQVAPSARPCVSNKLSSKPEPFRFGLDNGPKVVSKKCTAFKARPATVLKNKPFIPKPSPKMGIEVQEFKLHTQQRAAERRLKQLAERDRFEKERGNFMEKLKKDRAEILRKRKEIFERYHIKIKPLESKPTTVNESESSNVEKK